MKIIYIWEGLCVYYRHLCTLWLMMMKNKTQNYSTEMLGLEIYYMYLFILHVLIYITCTYLFVFNKYLINISSRIVYYWKCLLVFVKCPLPVFILTKHKQKLCDDCVAIVICNNYLLYLINCVSWLPLLSTQ